MPGQTLLNVLSMTNIEFSFAIVNGVCIEGHLLKSPSSDGSATELWGVFSFYFNYCGKSNHPAY